MLGFTLPGRISCFAICDAVGTSTVKPDGRLIVERNLSNVMASPLFLAVMVLTALPSAALAQISLDVSVNSSSNASAIHQPGSDGMLDVDSPEPVTIGPQYTSAFASYSTSGYSEAGSSATADYGTLAAWATALGQINYNSYSYGGFASSSATFSDYLQVNSTTLAPGTAVTLQFTPTLTGSIFGDGTYGTVALDIRVSSPYLAHYNAIWYRATNDGPSQGNLDPITLETFVGDDVFYTAALSVEVYSITGTVPSRITSSFGNTAHFYADSLTDGVTLSSVSGHNYATMAPVPEPEFYTMMLAGLGLVGFIARRRRLLASA